MRRLPIDHLWQDLRELAGQRVTVQARLALLDIEYVGAARLGELCDSASRAGQIEGPTYGHPIRTIALVVSLDPTRDLILRRSVGLEGGFPVPRGAWTPPSRPLRGASG